MDFQRKGIGYLSAVSLFLAAAMGIFAMTSCTNERKTALEAKLNGLNVKSDQLRQSIAEEEGVLQASNQRLSAQRAALSEYKASVQGYILDHKMAVAAVLAGVAGVSALDSNNRFSEDAKNVGLGVALIAAVWAAYNVDEVSSVFKVLNQADAHVRGLEAEISQTSLAIQQQQGSIQGRQERLRSLANQEAEVGQEISAL